MYADMVVFKSIYIFTAYKYIMCSCTTGKRTEILHVSASLVLSVQETVAVPQRHVIVRTVRMLKTEQITVCVIYSQTGFSLKTSDV